MSNCCKCAKWWPHNWLCLKGLAVLFLVLFYVTLAFTIFQDVQILRHPLITGSQMWLAVLLSTLSNLGIAIGFLTVAKVLIALRKIKQAVAPCGCSAKEEKAN